MTDSSQPSSLSSPRPLGRARVQAIGLGCMNVCHAYGAALPDEQARALIRQALDLGVDHFDTATLYGFGASETLVGQALRGERQRFFLASKCGMGGVDVEGSGRLVRVIDGRPATLRAQCEASLRRLQTDHIDLYYLHRHDPRVPIAESVGELARLQAEGKIGGIGLSEVSVALLRQAHAEAPITAIQNEFSLWTRNPEIALLDATRELGVALVAFSPLGRGFLTGRLRQVDDLAAGDIRRHMPRFAPDAYAANLRLLPALQALADEAGCSLAQLALAWVLAQGTHVHAIPGTQRAEHLRENQAALGLTIPPGLIARASAALRHEQVVGARYNAQGTSEVFSEEFAS
ncbi:aldo/keto reductase [Amphibiibacter pelophylacis]|uniref:Aldo/keto reductase n=1 Tax=Amphibiibacter pelophylacis TaxID=1799477 RepID=A0ACC6P045_9BURK